MSWAERLEGGHGMLCCWMVGPHAHAADVRRPVQRLRHLLTQLLCRFPWEFAGGEEAIYGLTEGVGEVRCLRGGGKTTQLQTRHHNATGLDGGVVIVERVGAIDERCVGGEEEDVTRVKEAFRGRRLATCGQGLVARNERVEDGASVGVLALSSETPRTVQKTTPLSQHTVDVLHRHLAPASHTLQRHRFRVFRADSFRVRSLTVTL
mmetsp:Transcript_11736/g.25047  ORF Transcript_11736/g.25047 Transcript_11736/m.25047 type:complete len:207 (-) Transcript_11736:553-1173(-)